MRQLITGLAAYCSLIVAWSSGFEHYIVSSGTILGIISYELSRIILGTVMGMMIGVWASETSMKQRAKKLEAMLQREKQGGGEFKL